MCGRFMTEVVTAQCALQKAKPCRGYMKALFPPDLTLKKLVDLTLCSQADLVI